MKNIRNSRFGVGCVFLLALLLVAGVTYGQPSITFKVQNLHAGPSGGPWMFSNDATPLVYNAANAVTSYRVMGWNSAGTGDGSCPSGGSGHVSSSNCLAEETAVLADTAGVSMNFENFQLSSFHWTNRVMGQAGDRRIYTGGTSSIKVNGVMKLRLKNCYSILTVAYPAPIGTNDPIDGKMFGEIDLALSDPAWASEFTVNGIARVSIAFSSFSPVGQDCYGAYSVDTVKVAPLSLQEFVETQSVVNQGSGLDDSLLFVETKTVVHLTSATFSSADGLKQNVVVDKIFAEPAGDLPRYVTSFFSNFYWRVGTVLSSYSGDITFDVSGIPNFVGGAPVRLLYRVDEDSTWEIYKNYAWLDSVHVRADSVTKFGEFALGATNPSSISGYKFNDTDQDSSWGTSEKGIQGWKIILSHPASNKTQELFTDSAGYYLFTDLMQGETYVVTEEERAGWNRTYPRTGTGYTVTIDTPGTVITDHTFGNYQQPGGALGGAVFHDLNGNSQRDAGEPALVGWKIYLGDVFALLPNNSPRYAVIDSTLSDANGNYEFIGLVKGRYVIKEADSTWWIQTLTGAPGFYFLGFDENGVESELNFANLEGCRWIGATNGYWSNPANWSCGRVPGSSDGIYVNGSVSLDDLPSDSVLALRVDSSGVLKFTTNATLRVWGPVQVDEGGTLDLTANGHLICYDDWMNNGTFFPGNSTIEFRGGKPKFIEMGGQGMVGSTFGKRAMAGGNKFYNLTIDGENTSTLGNITVDNQLTLDASLEVRPQDTVFIENPTGAAIAGEGAMTRGSIQRKITQGSTDRYRFESALSYIQFDGEPGSDYPDSILVSAEPDTVSPGFPLLWQVVPSTVNTDSNFITADSVTHFSKWTMGRPGPGVGKVAAGEYVAAGDVNRVYAIRAQGGGEFTGTAQLRYEQSEVNGDYEGQLQLLRGPFLQGTVQAGWNMLSLPLTPENPAKSTVFPAASSNAFFYDQTDGYTASGSLAAGKGYWLKFPAAETLMVMGDEIALATIPLAAGWNLIGVPSFAMDVTGILTEPEGIATGFFFGYSNSGYRISTTLTPLQGYWVKASAPGDLILAPLGIPPGAAGKALHKGSLMEGYNELKIRDAAGREQSLYFTGKTLATPGRYDLPPTPPQGIFDARFSSNRMLESAEPGAVKDIALLLSSAAYPVTLTWGVTPADPAAAALRIDGREVRLNTAGSVSVAHPGVEIVLALGGSPEVTPKTFALEQNYPNPFNPTTLIQYALPADARVSLKVYSLLGQEVSTLVDEVQEAGYRSVVWNARSEAGNALPSGVYFYRLTATRVDDAGTVVTLVRKMTIMK